MAVTTNSTVFNSSPKLALPDLLCCSSTTRTGEQYVAEAYAVNVGRWEQPAAYDALLGALAQASTELRSSGYVRPGAGRARTPPRAPSRAAAPRRDGRGPRRRAGWCDRPPVVVLLHDSLCAAVLPGLPVLRGRPGPAAAPTNGGQRAVLRGAAAAVPVGHARGGRRAGLDRSFGRAPIARLALPPSSPAPRSGRRYFVFLGLVTGADTRAVAVAAAVVAEARKALVLAPDTATATAASWRSPAGRCWESPTSPTAWSRSPRWSTRPAASPRATTGSTCPATTAGRWCSRARRTRSASCPSGCEPAPRWRSGSALAWSRGPGGARGGRTIGPSSSYSARN